MTGPIYGGNPDNVTIGQTRTITGVSNSAGECVVTTSVAHGFATSNTVRVGGVVGTTGANGTWQIVVLSSTTFRLTGSTYNAAYVSGGGAYDASCIPAAELFADGGAPVTAADINARFQIGLDRTQALARQAQVIQDDASRLAARVATLESSVHVESHVIASSGSVTVPWDGIALISGCGGGGGGGGGSSDTGVEHTGAGGGAGALWTEIAPRVCYAGEVYDIVIGAGGDGGPTGNPVGVSGLYGEDSTVKIGATLIMRAYGAPGGSGGGAGETGGGANTVDYVPAGGGSRNELTAAISCSELAIPGSATPESHGGCGASYSCRRLQSPAGAYLQIGSAQIGGSAGKFFGGRPGTRGTSLEGMGGGGGASVRGKGGNGATGTTAVADAPGIGGGGGGGGNAAGHAGGSGTVEILFIRLRGD